MRRQRQIRRKRATRRAERGLLGVRRRGWQSSSWNPGTRGFPFPMLLGRGLHRANLPERRCGQSGADQRVVLNR